VVAEGRPTKKGWWKPPYARKYHWFEDDPSIRGRSICGKRRLHGADPHLHGKFEGEGSWKNLSQDCAACWKKIDTRVGKEALKG
jgi:hypothetical protein